MLCTDTTPTTAANDDYLESKDISQTPQPAHDDGYNTLDITGLSSDSFVNAKYMLLLSVAAQICILYQ